MARDHNHIADLVEKVKKKDSNAFAELYRMLYKEIYFFALSLTKDKQMAEDVVQESFFTALNKIEQLEVNKTFVAWLNRIVYNNCMKEFNKNKKNQHDEYDEEIHENVEVAKDNKDPFTDCVKNDESKRILKAINNLPEPHKAVVMLFYYKDMKIKDIAQVLSCPPGTVKSRLNKAKERLKVELSKGLEVEL